MIQLNVISWNKMYSRTNPVFPWWRPIKCILCIKCLTYARAHVRARRRAYTKYIQYTEIESRRGREEYRGGIPSGEDHLMPPQVGWGTARKRRVHFIHEIHFIPGNNPAPVAAGWRP